MPRLEKRRSGRRIAVRSSRLPSTGPSAWIRGAESTTRRRGLPSGRAPPPGAGGAVRLQRPVDEEERTGATGGQLLGKREHIGPVEGVRGDHGVGRSAPQSSSMAINGVAQPVDFDRRATSSSAAAGIEAGSAGSEGVPTSRVTFMCQWTVWAPPARSSSETTAPLDASTRPGRRKISFGSRRSLPRSRPTGESSRGRPHGSARARTSAEGRRRCRQDQATASLFTADKETPSGDSFDDEEP